VKLDDDQKFLNRMARTAVAIAKDGNLRHREHVVSVYVRKFVASLFAAGIQRSDIQFALEGVIEEIIRDDARARYRCRRKTDKKKILPLPPADRSFG